MTANDEQRDMLEWAEAWQAGNDVASSTEEQIRSYVRKRSRFVLAFIAGDIVVAAIALPVLFYVASTTENVVQRFAMLALASVTIAAVGFGWWNWRGVVRASAASVSDYLDLSTERLRRMRLASRVAWLVLFAEVMIFTIWIQDLLYGGTGPVDRDAERFSWAWLLGFTLAAVLALLRFGRWLARDAKRFESLRSDYTEASTSVGDSTRIRSIGARAIKKPRRPPLT